MLELQSVREYMDLTLQLLKLDLWMYENSEQAKWNKSKKEKYWTRERWLEEGWKKLGPRFDSKIKAAATLNELTSGAFKWQDRHVKTFHSVLTLDQYGLDWKDVWGPVDGSEIRYNLGEFRDLLQSSLSQHKDPLHLIRRNIEPLFSLRLDGPGMSMPVADVEGRVNLVEGFQDAVIKRVGENIPFQVTPRAEGHVLLFTHVHRTSKTAILNEHLDVPRTKIHAPYEPIWFKPALATGEPGRRDIIAINWPKTINPALYNLAGFFARNDYTVHDDELRWFGAAIRATAGLSDAERVFVKMVPLTLEP